MWPALIAAGASLLGSYLSSRGSSGGSSGDASGYLNRIAPMAKEQFNPYIQRGNEAQGLASGKYNQMAADPMAFLNQITAGYNPSEGYKFKEKRALEAARNSAAAGGFSGTRNDQLQQAEMTKGLLGQDMQEWLSNVLGIQGAGLMGQQHVADTGFHASQSLADMLGQALGAQSGLAYEDVKEKRGNNQALMGGLGNLIEMGIGALSGGKGGASGGKGGGLSNVLGGLGTGLGKSPGRGGAAARGFGGGFNPASSFKGSVYGGGKG